MRGFGGPQAVFVLEAAIERAARQLGMAPERVRERNLLGEGDLFPFGQLARRARAQACWRWLRTSRNGRRHHCRSVRGRSVTRASRLNLPGTNW